MTPRAHDDEGLTMIELVLYIVLSGVVGAIIVSLVVGTLTSQNTVTHQTEASGRGQVISQSLDRALRNAKAIDTFMDGGNQVLVVLTTLDEPCQRWRITPGGKFEVSSGAGSPPWGELADGVQRNGTDAYFAPTGSRFRYSFALATEGKPLLFTGTIASRGVSGTVGTVGTACS